MKNAVQVIGENIFRIGHALLVFPVKCQILIKENFEGVSGPLNGTTADTFDAAITTAGGSGTWAAGVAFLDNGTVSVDAGQNAASLNLGSYVNAAKGTIAGKFKLAMTISPTVGAWISLGFATNNSPSTTANFTAGAVGGIGTIIYRAVSNPGELDMFGGLGNGGAVDGPDGNSGNRTVTVTLDLTPAGGYNGTNNFGTVIWSDSQLGALGSYTYTSARDFGSILISEAFIGAYPSEIQLDRSDFQLLHFLNLSKEW